MKTEGTYLDMDDFNIATPTQTLLDNNGYGTNPAWIPRVPVVPVVTRYHICTPESSVSFMPCYLPLLHKFSPLASIIPFLLLSFTFTHLPSPFHMPTEKEMTDNIPMGGGFFLLSNTVIGMLL
jgi:hypothetical protein